ncbi:hypothetical protein [Kangiella aquimarina]|uniref:Uncharacterized protein n=1 Tax=Kangiella aquimarina TaxID=261965 RepID=A0ABZ0X525_9GAMM|nr:hypothetical protein [Kangiella aquimarina]WQG85481.1 hypothetical protein SR900_01045 [Kangiella aquimarina]
MKYPDPRTLRLSEISRENLLEDEVVIISEAHKGQEARGEVPLWQELKKSDPARVIEIERIGHELISVNVEGKPKEEIELKNINRIKELIGNRSALIDITSMRHNVWAPIIRTVKNFGIDCRVLYVEPGKYAKHPSPSSETVFDLTTSFESMVPLPTFSVLDGPKEGQEALFVTMLGFEGSRPTRLLMEIEPAPEVIPIVGVPGFKVQYPTYTVTCNKSMLKKISANKLRAARASCPFEVYEILVRLRESYPNHYIYIAPVGTKPHGLGAVLFMIDYPESAELLYDNPLGKSGRTEGKALYHLYKIQ